MRIGPSGEQPNSNQPVQEHTIQKGETLESIAAQYQIPPDTLLAANPILNVGISPGQIIQIPNIAPQIDPLPPSDTIEKPNQNVFETLVPHDLLRAGPPYVPVRMLKEAMEEPSEAPLPEVEMTLKPEEVQINENGQLIIMNEELVEYFKTLMRNASEQSGPLEVHITQKKIPEENE
jgi:LysM repeat protein